MKKTLLSLLMILALLTGCAPSGGSSAPEEGEGPQSSSVQPAPIPEPEPEPEPTVVRLMAAGDVMSHMPITNDAFVAASGTYSFSFNEWLLLSQHPGCFRNSTSFST